VGQESDGRIYRWSRSPTEFNLADGDSKSGAAVNLNVLAIDTDTAKHSQVQAAEAAGACSVLAG